MKMFTNINNIFILCVDNVKKLSYNVKRTMSKIGRFMAEIPKIILFVLLFIMAILFSVFNADSAENIQNSACVAVIDLDLSVVEVGDEQINVGLTYDGEDELCGILLEMVFDPEICKIKTVCDGSGLDESARITYFEDAGKIVLMLDSFSGLGSGELAVIGFSLLSDMDGDIDVSISGGCGSACVMRNGILEKAHISNDLLSVKAEPNFSESHGTVNLSFNDNGCMTVSGYTSNPCNFLGFDITVTDIYGASTQNFTVSSKSRFSDAGTYTATVDLPCVFDENCVVAVSSVRYERDRTVYGEENVFVIRKGSVCCINATCEDE